jgi:putative hemolysin
VDPSVAIQLISIVLLLILSAFFSSAETALTTASQIRLQSKADEGNKRALKVLKITSDMSKMLSAILVGNNIVNISASALVTALAIGIWGPNSIGIATGILTLLVLIFGEISPKTVASKYPETISMAYSGIISVLMKLLTPVIFIINMISLGLMKLFRIDVNKTNISLSTSEIRTIVNASHKNGELESDAHKVINNMFDFREAQAKDIMIPRIDMTFVSVECTYDELLEIYEKDKFTRLPVYQNDTNDVVGIINMKDLLLVRDTDSFDIRAIMREPFFTYEHKNTAELFIKMRDESISMTIVLDEYGDTAGLITLEDLLEEIVGDIHDEYDADEEQDLTAVGAMEYMIQGSMDLDDLNETLHVNLISDDYDSVGGYIFGLLDHLPSEGEDITTENGIYFKVESMNKNRVEKLYMKIPDEFYSFDL